MTTRRQAPYDKAIERYESLEPWLFRVMTSLTIAATPGTRPSQIHLDAVFEDQRGRHLHLTFGGVQDFCCAGWSGVITDPFVIVLNDDPDFFWARYRVYTDRDGPITSAATASSPACGGWGDLAHAPQASRNGHQPRFSWGPKRSVRRLVPPIPAPRL